MMTIALATLQEAVRKKLFVAIGIITLIYLGLYTALVYYYAKDINQSPGAADIFNVSRIVTQIVGVVGFYFSNMLVALLTIVTSFGAISSEVENGTIHSVLSKPLRRGDYLMGKYLGLAALTVAYAVILYFGVLGIAQVCHLSFTNSLRTVNVLQGLLFFILQPVTILAPAICGSSIFKTLTNGIIMISLYLLSLIGGMMEQIGAMVNQSAYLWGIFASLLAPFEVIYRLMVNRVFADLGISNPLMISMSGNSTVPSQWMVLYIGLYIIGLLLVACRRFNRRDLV